MRGTWTEYVKVFPAAARFEKIGWPFHELMAPLMPSKAKGGSVFRPRGAPETGGARSSSPGWDEEQMNRDFGGEDKDDDDEMEGNRGGAGGPDYDDDGDGDGETSSPLASGKTGKRVAAQAASIYRKKPRLSAGGQALTDIASSAAEFNEIFAGFPTTATPDPAAGASTATTAPAPAFQPSPQRRLNAIQFAKQEAWLDPPYRVALVRVLRNIIKADDSHPLAFGPGLIDSGG
ncbi:hypothetical protein B0H11DRAFT_1915941 [Mycena galericulata]|nr:hypothetical protein B0H11DRAFT_1915941 [Mycena galericulata]